MDIRLFYYYFSFVLGLVLACFVNALAAKRRGIAAREAFSYTLTGFAGAVLGAVLMAKIYNAVLRAVSPGVIFGESRVSLYGGLLFMPLFMLLPVFIKKQSPSEVYSVCAPGVFCLLGCAKTGCFVYGCCYGISCEHGFFNALAGERVFPVQLLESVFSFIIALLLYFLFSSKTQNKTAYPAGLILYGAMRFSAQFLRHHDAVDKSLIGFADFWQLVSVIAIITGVFWLIGLLRSKKPPAERG